MEKSNIYKDYWVNTWQARDKRQYYQKLYNRVKSRLVVPGNAKILDVGGGNGHFLSYLGIKNADIIDISDSGVEVAGSIGFGTINADIEKTFPIKDGTYNIAFCFEVLEHLKLPQATLSETNRILKSGGILYVGQPNMPADGVHHVRRYYLKDIISELNNANFSIEWIDFVPAFTMPDAILDDIRKTKSIFRKFKQSIALLLSFLPWRIRYLMAKIIPNRFALLFIIKAVKR
ncbi:MAG: class I SAM-dependent methyltransferase [Candidatus Omnitrophota bacterium]|jgi:SAM-dependent methyltransferase